MERGGELALKACELSEWKDWGVLTRLLPLMPGKVISIRRKISTGSRDR
jgi:hypothetical protein